MLAYLQQRAPASLSCSRTTTIATRTTHSASPTLDWVPDTAQQQAAHATRPTSPAIPFESESILLKAKRAYDRDRQRVKKRKERADRDRDRDRNAGSEPSALNAHQHTREGSGAGKRAKPRLALGLAAGTEKENLSLAVAPAFPLSPQVEEIIADVVERAAQARGEVPLDELVAVRPGKARKSKAGEFELVPSVPVVIALDDAMPDEAELDEPWEHISADELDEKRVAPPSYATVLANAL
ncbi:hypothetical protein C8Q80DRAFT_1215238 [Daedaleopsis nitida]|nr:hypothetical protein C8Q80DRAFT_1215238 [Daedaleopsis nitida]